LRLQGGTPTRLRSRQAATHGCTRIGCRQIDDEIKLRRLLDRNVAWLRSVQNLVDVVTPRAE